MSKNYRSGMDDLIAWMRSEDRSLPIDAARKAIDAFASLCDDMHALESNREESIAHLERIMSYAGEHSLAESAENRMREMEDMKIKIIELRAALELNQNFLASLEKINPDAGCPQLMLQNEAALVISTTDSAWTGPLHKTLGLLRAAKSHIPESSIAGSFMNALDTEIERLEKILPREP